MTYPSELPPESILPSPYQPRTMFRLDKLQELAVSVGRLGIKQPLVVRPVGDTWELVAGERRLRAARMAGLRMVPVSIQAMSDAEAEEVCLQENLVRENLEPMEEARAYGRLQDRGLSVQEIAAKMCKELPRVRFYLLLLNLKPEYQGYVEQGILPLPQAADVGRLPAEQQRMAMRWLTTGVHHTEFTRRVTALVEQDTQTSLVPPADDTDHTAGRLAEALERIMTVLGRCSDKKTLELAGWVTGGDAEVNLKRAELARRSLDHIIDALRKARARQVVRRESA